MKKTINNWGFTLIELLVVIAIIGILAAISLVSFTSSQKQAKDIQRKSDLAQFRNALENYASKNNGLYPLSVGSIDEVNLCSPIYLNLSSCPKDPKTPTLSYHYCTNDGTGSGGNPTAVNYVLWASLENVTGSLWTVCSDGRSGISNTAPNCGASFNCNIP